jgi:hypothetical protein
MGRSEPNDGGPFVSQAGSWKPQDDRAFAGQHEWGPGSEYGAVKCQLLSKTSVLSSTIFSKLV